MKKSQVPSSETIFSVNQVKVSFVVAFVFFLPFLRSDLKD